MTAPLDWHTETEPNIRLAIAKLYIGEHLTDQELFVLITMYRDLERGLKLVGNQFHIAWSPIYDNLRKLEKFAEFRLKGT